MASKAERRRRQQAAAEALIRFGPELSGLKELQRQAAATYRTEVKQAKDTALGISGAARTARPQIQKVYERAGGQLTNTFNQVQQDIAPAGPGQSAIDKAIIAENAAARTRIREERAGSYKDLTNRIVNAQEGRAYAVQAAKSTRKADLGKVASRMADVLREKGAFQTTTLGGLRQADQDAALRITLQRMSGTQAERGSLRSAGIDPDTGLAIPGGPLDRDANRKPGDQSPGRSGSRPTSGPGSATPTRTADAQDAIAQARQIAAQQKRGGGRMDDAISSLVSGVPATKTPLYKTVEDPLTHRTKQVRVLKGGVPQFQTTPAIPKIGHALLVRAAVEAEYLGYISKRTQRLLHNRGLRVKDLGLPSYGSGAARRRPALNSYPRTTPGRTTGPN